MSPPFTSQPGRAAAPGSARVCLASASPRRRELLRQIGVAHVVVPAHIDETPLPAEVARDYVMRLARQKAMAVRQSGQALPVLSADTTVVLDGRIFGKPADRDEAIGMLQMLSGRSHDVLTAIALADDRGVVARLSTSNVRFRTIGLEECAAYWETGEPRDKAGAYAIQGYGAVFVESLHGSYSAVVGLPLLEAAELLRAAGVPTWSAEEPIGVPSWSSVEPAGGGA